MSSCVFGFPASFSNISSPCPVSCDPVRPAVEADITNPSSSNFNSWCGTSTFADNVVNSCEFCYNLTATQNQKQVYLANCMLKQILSPKLLNGDNYTHANSQISNPFVIIVISKPLQEVPSTLLHHESSLPSSSPQACRSAHPVPVDPA